MPGASDALAEGQAAPARPWPTISPRPQLGKAARQLILSPHLSDQQIAAAAGTSYTPVREARQRLEAAGIIPVIPPDRRTRVPYPQPPSRTRDAIEAGASTPREIADAAGVSMQAAWKAWRQVNPPLAELAAAADALTVAHLLACTSCGTPFAPSRHGGFAQRFCSPGCRQAARRKRLGAQGAASSVTRSASSHETNRLGNLGTRAAAPAARQARLAESVFLRRSAGELLRLLGLVDGPDEPATRELLCDIAAVIEERR